MADYHARRAQTLEPLKKAARDLLRQRSGLTVRQVAAQVNLSYSTVFILAHELDCVPHQTRTVKPKPPRVRLSSRPKSHHQVVAERQRHAILMDAQMVDQHTNESEAQRIVSTRNRADAQQRIHDNHYLRGVREKIRST